jgi:MoxR-like ATPase
MMLAARVAALRDGRANVAYDDIAPVVAPALRHRLILNFEAQADGISPQSVIDDLLGAVRP